jgi:hypothetical protein
MGQVVAGRLNAGARFPERRTAPRFAFDADLQITEPVQQEQITGQVTVLSQRGCFGRTKTSLNDRGVVQARIQKADAVFETWAWATPSHPETETGVVLVFMDTTPEQAKVLAGWLEELAGS